MRISDWSSDVCSPDLSERREIIGPPNGNAVAIDPGGDELAADADTRPEPAPLVALIEVLRQRHVKSLSLLPHRRRTPARRQVEIVGAARVDLGHRRVTGLSPELRGEAAQAGVDGADRAAGSSADRRVGEEWVSTWRVRGVGHH